MAVNQYHILGQLFLGLPDTDLKELFITLPLSESHQAELAELLAPFPTNDELAAEHYLALGMGAFPFGHYFLSPEGNFGGENDSQLIGNYLYHKFPYDQVSGGAEASHLGVELEFLSHLEDNKDAKRAFIAGHILAWLPTFTFALREVGSPLFSWLADYTLKLVLEEWINCGGEDHPEELSIVLPHWDVLKDFLELKETGIRDIAQNLTLPAFSGFFLSKSSLKKLASGLDIPMGFGERTNLLENLLKESIRYEEVGPFIQKLTDYNHKWKRQYQELPDSMAKIKEEWLRVNAYTETLLEKFHGASERAE